MMCRHLSDSLFQSARILEIVMPLMAVPLSALADLIGSVAAAAGGTPDGQLSGSPHCEEAELLMATIASARLVNPMSVRTLVAGSSHPLACQPLMEPES
jgi:hypothetical protein